MYFNGFRDNKCPLMVSKLMRSLSGLNVISPSLDLELISVLYRVIDGGSLSSFMCLSLGLEIISVLCLV